MGNGFSISVLFHGHNVVTIVATIIFGIVRAIFAASGLIIILRLARVSRDVNGVFLVWGWVVLVFSFVSFSGMIEVSVLVDAFAGSSISCCSVA